MKDLLRRLFSPILNVFEKGDEPYAYKPLNRKILMVMGVLFSGLAALIVFMSPDDGSFGFLIPVTVFSTVSFVCIVVGALGNERAVAKIWGNR